MESLVKALWCGRCGTRDRETEGRQEVRNVVSGRESGTPLLLPRHLKDTERTFASLLPGSLNTW